MTIFLGSPEEGRSRASRQLDCCSRRNSTSSIHGVVLPALLYLPPSMSVASASRHSGILPIAQRNPEIEGNLARPVRNNRFNNNFNTTVQLTALGGGITRARCALAQSMGLKTFCHHAFL